MNLDEIRFEAYKDAAARCRWFFLITVLLSGLILSQLYLEVMSFQIAQLDGTLAHRLKQSSDLRLSEAEQKIAEATKEERQAPEFQKLIDDYGSLKFRVTVTDNTIRGTTFGDRGVPFLDFAIPSNDYVPVLSIFLVIFSSGLWLNMRSLSNIIQSDEVTREFRQAINLHFTFTGVHAKNPKAGISVFFQYLAIWAPAITLIIAIPVDFLIPMQKQASDPSLYAGPPEALMLRGITLVFSLLILLLLALMNSRLARRTDRAAHPQASL